MDRSIEERVARLEFQAERFISDAESEKETRRRSNMHVDDCFDKHDIRLRRLEWLVAIGVGATLFIQIAARFIK